jgi:hypothetical protein
MPFKMMESAHVDENEWPTLDGRPVAFESTEGEQDWEILAPDESSSSTESNQEEGVLVDSELACVRMMHSASSPSLYHPYVMIGAPKAPPPLDDTSFALVPGPKPAVSFASTTLSFRDAILSRPSSTVIEGEEQDFPGRRTSLQQRGCVKPRCVVKPIRRCSKSTGDLLSLIHEEEEVMGVTDAMDYYHRKNSGVKNRASGLKKRPDEVKRKEIIIQKKGLQRRVNSVKGS